MTTNRKLSELDTLSSLQDDDEIYVVRPSLDEAERSRRILAQNARSYLVPGAVPLILESIRTITNAELKNLDTTYIELVEAPRNGKYIQVEQLWMEKTGDDPPATVYPRSYHVAISEDNALTTAEAAAGNSATFTFVNIPTWPSGDRYIFVGVPTSHADIVGLNVPTTEEPEDFFARVFEEYAPIVEVDGVPIKWWRTTLAYATPEEVFRQTYVTGWTVATGPTISDILQRMWIGSIFVEPTVDVADYPVHSASDEYAWVAGNLLETVLRSPDERLWGEAVGAHGFLEDMPLVLAAGLTQPRTTRDRYYSAAAFDEYMLPVNDVELLVVVRYQIHDLYVRV